MSLTHSPKARILADTEIQQKIAVAKAALAGYQVFMLEHYDRMNPSVAIARLKQELGGLREPQAIEDTLKAIADFSNAGAIEAADAYKALAAERFEAARQPLLSLLHAARPKLQAFLAEVQEAESAFFAGWGMARHETPVFSRYRAALAELENHVQGWGNMPNSTLPPADATPLARLFGVSLTD
jgi:hypothetical protein